MRLLAAIVAATALTVAPAARADEPYGKTQGVIPGMLIGPKLTLLLYPPAIGLEAKLLGNKLGLSFDYGGFPSTDVDQAKVSWSDWNVAARFYPWAARFYVGAAYGSRNFTVSAKDDTTGREAKASVSSAYIAPEIGWKFVWENGFFMGIDLGYEIILNHSATFTIPVNVDPQKDKDVRDAADKVGKAGLPILGLLQVGWFF